MKKFQKSMLTLGTAVAITGVAAAYVPAIAADNPCAPKAAAHHHRHHKPNPCAAAANPCAAKANPCATTNPCAAANPCAAKSNPCAAH